MDFKRLNILLCCNLGASTGVMVTKMREIAAGSTALKDVDVLIEAHPASDIKEYIDHFDVVLIGPQIKHRFLDLKEICDERGKPIEVIDTKDYGTVNGANILKQAIYLRINQTEAN
ncbi:PTS sugar transporter subunit IIB [Erysipelothrix urinaevulpis]|uniref:PTS sugar transporter subunit IIB n=1 Tax=Erysipelothrix urinaevulpis TaxID=2683717 RepID=UPI001356AA67|nr:PTS sugar transporter subunit IIB [Erysipelothrix urinaevulpis]